MKAAEGELRDYCRTKLSAFEVPERIYVVTDFPPHGKGSTDRRAIARYSLLAVVRNCNGAALI